MTVKELAGMLAEMVRDGEGAREVRFIDTYTRNEGWEDGYESATCEVHLVELKPGEIILCHR